MSMNVMARMMYHDTKMSLPFLAYGIVSKGWHEYQEDVVEMVIVDDASVAKMSGGDVHVEPYLNSRNTIGHGTATQILKVRSGNTCQSRERVSNGGGMRKL